MSVNVYGHEFEVHVPKEKEQLYLSAAKYANKKIDAYMNAFVRIPLLQKSTQEILIMAMLDIAVCSIECKQSNENCSFFWKDQIHFEILCFKGNEYKTSVSVNRYIPILKGICIVFEKTT